MPNPLLLLIAAAFAVAALGEEGEGFWETFDEVVRLRRAERLVEAFERLPALEARATSDVERAYALGERVYLFTVMGTPDRATEPFRRMKERFEALGDACPPGAFFAELQYELPYRLAIDDFAGVERRVAEAAGDARFSFDAPWAGAARLELKRQRAMALAARARAGEGDVDLALATLSRLTEELDYRGPEILLPIGAIALDRGDLAGAQAALAAAEAEVSAWRLDGRASDLDELNLAVLRVWVALATPGAPPKPLAAARDALAVRWRRALDRWAVEDAEGGVGLLHYDLRQDALAALVHAAIVLGEGPSRALEIVIETQEESALARALGAEGVSLDALRDALLEGADHVVLVLLPGTRGGAAFLVAQDDVLHATLDARPRGGTPRTPEATAVANDRLPVLPAPIARRLAAAERVTVCAIGPLADAPLERLEARDGHPLMRTHALDFAPSLPVAAALAAGARLRRDAPLDESAPLVVLVSAPEPSAVARARWEWLDGAPLGGLAWEEAVDAYPEARVERLRGPSATARAIAEAGVARVLQVFAHGVADPDLVRPATLVLSPEVFGDAGLFTCAAAEASAAPALVVLGACSAAAGPYRGGDESASDLAGAFLRAGAFAVVASDERIDAREALDLATRFHVHLAHGRSPAEALRRARAERWEEEGVDDASGFRVVGAGQVPVFAVSVADEARGVRRAAAVALLALLALLLFGLAARARRRRSPA